MYLEYKENVTLVKKFENLLNAQEFKILFKLL